MALELRQQLKLTQQLLMTPQLQQAIKLLQLSRMELAETLRQEVEQNPLLEEVAADDPDTTSLEAITDKETSGAPESERTGEVSMESNTPMQEINWDDYDNHYEASFSFSHETPDPNKASRLDFLAKKPNLQSHLHWQLSHTDLSEKELEAGNFVIGNLNRHGFLDISVEDIVSEIECSAEEARRAITAVQSMDPPGVGGRDVKESLLLQLERLGLQKSSAATIISGHMHSLETRNYNAIAKAIGRPLKEVQAAVEVIVRLEPYPGRLYSDEETHYIIPDVYVHKVGDEYVIILNDEGLPRLQVSEMYQDMLDNETAGSAEAKNYLKDKHKDAVWLIKSIQQRQRTIYKVMESILRFQREFFEKGVAHLRPLVLKDVADDIEMHESTVSRVTTNKYTHTPQGIFELKYFFSTAIKRSGGESLASESIKDRIRTLIKNEDLENPFTDSALSLKFAEENIKVARRTVAKYREQMGILPVKMRRQPKT